MKNKSRKMLALLLVVAMVLTMLAGCGGRKSSNGNREEVKRAPVVEKNNDSEAGGESETIRKPSNSGGGREMSSEEIANYSKTRVVKVLTDRGTGSGFFIDNKGTLITNYHVIEGAESISIKFDSGASHQVNNIVDFSPYYDIAVLEADVSNTEYFNLANEYHEGEHVYVRGYPKGVETSSFTSGMMSQSSHRLGLMDCITIDAAISNGNSGGPAMNSRGEVLGICSYGRNDAQNMNFAIKLSALDQLSMDKNYSISRYREWYNRETGRSYMATADGKDFYYTYVHTYTNVTGVECEMSFDSERDYVDGYSIMYLYYIYEYDSKSYDEYCDYLYSIGFEYKDELREMGLEGVEYYHAFEGYSVCLFVDTVDNLLFVSCPVY